MAVHPPNSFDTLDPDVRSALTKDISYHLQFVLLWSANPPVKYQETMLRNLKFSNQINTVPDSMYVFR